MQYAIIGAGGTGGVVGYFMTKAGKDVTLIARGRHLEAMKEHGLTLERLWDPNPETIAVKATDMEHYKEQPDVILVCVKGYSLEDTVPFIRRVAKPDTIVIPILNIYGTGAAMNQRLPELTILDGCIYIVAYIEEPGVICQSGNIFKVVFGPRKGKQITPIMKRIKEDLEKSQIEVVLSDDIESEAFLKYTFIAPYAAAGAYFDVPAQFLQENCEMRSTFHALVEEIVRVGKALGLTIPEDIVEKNMAILDQLLPGTTASMQKDLKRGGQSEIDGLIFEVIRKAKMAQVSVPMFQKVADKFN